MSEESRLKIAAQNKMKQLQEEVEHLSQQVEDEEEAKTALQNKLMQLTQQVSPWLSHDRHMTVM